MDTAFSSAARPPVIVVINRDDDFRGMLTSYPEFIFGRSDVESHGFRTTAEAGEFLEKRKGAALEGRPLVDLIILPVYNDEFETSGKSLFSVWHHSHMMGTAQEISAFESGPFLDTFASAAKHVLLLATNNKTLEVAERADLPGNVALYPLSFFPGVRPLQEVAKQLLALPAGETPPALFQKMTIRQEREWLAERAP